MKSKTETFASLMDSFTYRYDTRSVFEDFLTMSMCAVTQIPGEGKSHYEDLYLETIAKYAKDEVRHVFPKLFSQLIVEMEARVSDSMGNDVLGDYYEQHFCKRGSGQFFTPFPVCEFMSMCLAGDETKEADKPLRILDPTCGSGRMLIAAGKNFGPGNEYYGIDIDHTCVKMAALNLFLNGRFHSEVMCADALRQDDFRISYAISMLPLGIFRIEDKEKSKLWHMHKNSFEKKNRDAPKAALKFISEDSDMGGKGTQMNLF
ncbi:MAG: SAM-dependent methyltransferase [Flavipsychrobacter sp.]|nr:SAM-dependent methyltransferase [Flavipsychrobacter sp.]